jgi:xanthine dehydrogenase YagR molybdenum-binding subunit
MVAVIDAGTIVNERTARNQVTGAITMGLGQALLEEVNLEPATGRIANANLADYLVPVNADIPDLDVVFLDYPDTNFTETGVRGLGELGCVGSAAAIANAVYHATGKRIRDLPITADKLFE